MALHTANSNHCLHDQCRKKYPQPVGTSCFSTAEELEYHRSSLVLGYPGRFETPDYLLSQQVGVWRYGLPSDWVQSYISRVQGVSLEQAQAAFAQHIASQPLAIVVVGDLATLREGLSALGYPVTQADADGRPLTP